jgi:hypothetical protein
MALIKAGSCLRRYLRFWHSAYTQNRTHWEQPSQTRQFPSLTQVKPTANACSKCCVRSFKYLYEENTIKIVILRIQCCKVHKTNQYDLIIIIIINCKVRWLTVSSSQCCRLFPLFLKLLVIGNGLSLRFTSFHFHLYGRTSHLRVPDEVSLNFSSSTATRMRVQNISLRKRLYCRWRFNLLGN